MPLHLPRLHGRSRSRSPQNRTDLCSTYSLTPSEREAQGLLCRSEWTFDTSLLFTILKNALRSGDTDWSTWSVEPECRKIRHYHFEDLDRLDQEACEVSWAVLSELRNRVAAVANLSEVACLGDVVELLDGFKEQARQLYGPSRYGAETLRELLESDGESDVENWALS